MKIDWRKLACPEFDYTQLEEMLSSYSQPRKKISELIASGKIIRVKKGLYVYSESEQLPSVLRLANLIYGPSYVSLESALAFHNLIPEVSKTVLSVTPNRKKFFSTPLGDFSYFFLNPKYYHLGFDIYKNDNNAPMIIATAEKALVDTVWFSRTEIAAEELDQFLLEDLRIEKVDLKRIRIKNLEQIVSHYKHPVIGALSQVVRKIVK